MSVVAGGEDVRFTLRTGRKRAIYAPRDAWLMFDETGKTWPECSLLIASISLSNTREATKEDVRGMPGQWLGKDYDAHVSSTNLPPRSLDSWTLVGPLARIWYQRVGTYAPAFFKHDFNKPRGVRWIQWLVKRSRTVNLYKRGDAFRVELGKGCILTPFGIEYP